MVGCIWYSEGSMRTWPNEQTVVLVSRNHPVDDAESTSPVAACTTTLSLHLAESDPRFGGGAIALGFEYANAQHQLLSKL